MPRGVAGSGTPIARTGPRSFSVWLRVSRTGRAFAFHASRDGERWTFVRLFTLGEEKEADAALVGFTTQSPMGEGCVVTAASCGDVVRGGRCGPVG